MLPSCMSGAYPSDGSFAQDVPLELRDGAENRIEHSAGGSRRIEVLGKRSQRDIAFAKYLFFDSHIE